MPGIINDKTGSGPYTTGTGTALVPGQRDTYTYNGLVLNDRSQHERFHTDNIVGFDDADLRISEDENPADLGSTPNPSWPGGRTMVLGGKFLAGNWDRLDDLEAALKLAFKSRVELPLVIKRPGRIMWKNLMINPGAEVDLTGFTYTGNTGGGITRTTAADTFATGTAAVQITGSTTPGTNSVRSTGARFAATAGLPYSAACVFKSAAAVGRLARVYIDFLDVNGTRTAATSGSNITVLTSGFTRAILVNAIAPANTTQANIICEVTTGAAGEVFYVDSMMAVQSATLPNYFDGDMAGYRWASTPGLSISQSSLGDVQIYCRKSEKLNIPRDIKSDRYERDFQVTLRATDPRIESVDNFSVSKVPTVAAGTLTFPGAGGLSFPASGGITFTSTNTATATNVGNENAEPIIRLDGPLSNVSIYNSGTGERMYLGVTLAAGEYLLIDIANGTITDQNGNNRFGVYDITTDWITLAPGTNVFTIDTATASGTSKLTVTWNDTWL